MEEFMANYGVYVGMFLLLIEYVLGKTDLVKANSMLELFLNAVLSLGRKLLPEKQ